ncbi:hypothetical protein M083_2598 [Bacteroides fragilis str. 3986 T(B)9]|uniref:Uncharacterized protein n=8 Tax=Bacteroides fragilis TaxID=817 RepID=A0A016CJH0_BACFG|nr:hypothetical protein M083_4816 [Bacteroides fragilis str. 3986 T(B)9]EXZ71544.1 hypothetical protein M123_4099 [Bacteroides fragilis str. 3976T8]EYA69562.1 hypothetical protein M132_3836 [Bacteroides fragilis str. S24L15]EXY67616.1 hypothetical protein M083_4776 [Bacteroides fragilis str. 3986 T(B)9]EXY68597.1 hypothetical protein M083_3765 [Bacteroides fragilis str. 3986 T(B)9]
MISNVDFDCENTHNGMTANNKSKKIDFVRMVVLIGLLMKQSKEINHFPAKFPFVFF